MKEGRRDASRFQASRHWAARDDHAVRERGGKGIERGRPPLPVFEVRPRNATAVPLSQKHPTVRHWDTAAAEPARYMMIEKVAVVEPIPRTSRATAVSVNRGDRRKRRPACLMSRQRISAWLRTEARRCGFIDLVRCWVCRFRCYPIETTFPDVPQLGGQLPILLPFAHTPRSGSPNRITRHGRSQR